MAKKKKNPQFYDITDGLTLMNIKYQDGDD